MQSSSNLAIKGGGASKSFAQAGTITNYAIEITHQSIWLPKKASPNGMRLNASNATFKLKVPVNNGETLALSTELKSKDLEDYNIASISKQLVELVRSDAVKPTLNGAAMSQKPTDGSSMSVKVGSSTYKVTYTGVEMVVSGPEQQRLIASLTENAGSPITYTVSLAAPGVMSGRSIEVLDDTDAAEFGLASNNDGATALLQGKAFSLSDGASDSFDLMVGSTTVTVSVSRSGNNCTLSSNNSSKLKFVSPVSGATR